MKLYIFVQARMSSKRLPGKVLIKIKKKNCLEHIHSRLDYFGSNKIIILTSKNSSDEPIHRFCIKKKYNFFKGPLNNVYSRYCMALKTYKCDAFIRVTGDSPLISSKIIKEIVKIYKKKKYDIVTNCLIKTFPTGQSVEMIDSQLFLKYEKKIIKQNDKEHIFSYFYRNKNKFKIFNLRSKIKYKIKHLSLDNFSDIKFLSKKIK